MRPRRYRKDLKQGEYYVTTYCNFAHCLRTGNPINHECRHIPVAALRAEIDGDFEEAIRLMSGESS